MVQNLNNNKQKKDNNVQKQEGVIQIFIFLHILYCSYYSEVNSGLSSNK